MTANGRVIVSLLGCCVLGVATQAADVSKSKKTTEGHSTTKQSSRLYTPPDPSATGGLRGRVPASSEKLVDAFAIPSGELMRVYKAKLSADGHAFEFPNLPTAKYDLLLVGPNAFYEGLCLDRAASTLTPNDLRSITAILNKSEPFYELKKIHRCEGHTGAAGNAHCVLQEVRARPITFQDATVHAEYQVRAIKLVLFEDVGPNWQLVTTREIIRQEVVIAHEHPGLLPHVYCPGQLSGLRVVDSVKDLGVVELPKIK
ncbi:MAG: hypothetical protein EPN23_07205 [Verrucomicrobia bacterium]|nr:MAG: hypothetical protein EPN23_07205 [Verrucomicrobiota bacterium]